MCVIRSLFLLAMCHMAISHVHIYQLDAGHVIIAAFQFFVSWCAEPSNISGHRNCSSPFRIDFVFKLISFCFCLVGLFCFPMLCVLFCFCFLTQPWRVFMKWDVIKGMVVYFYHTSKRVYNEFYCKISLCTKTTQNSTGPLKPCLLFLQITRKYTRARCFEMWPGGINI